MDLFSAAMKTFSAIPRLLLVGVVLLGFATAGCSRLLPPRKGETTSYQIAIDTRRLPVPTLTGCFIPQIFPAISKLPIISAQKVPAGTVYKTATIEVLSKAGELAVLETVIEDNQVYLKFAAKNAEDSVQCNVLVRLKYEYGR